MISIDSSLTLKEYVDVYSIPKAPEGYRYYWARYCWDHKTVKQETDLYNLWNIFIKGWTPVLLDRHPEMSKYCDSDANKSFICHRGSVLCECPEQACKIDEDRRDLEEQMKIERLSSVGCIVVDG
jgi:hypothetical protein